MYNVKKYSIFSYFIKCSFEGNIQFSRTDTSCDGIQTLADTPNVSHALLINGAVTCCPEFVKVLTK